MTGEEKRQRENTGKTKRRTQEEWKEVMRVQREAQEKWKSKAYGKRRREEVTQRKGRKRVWRGEKGSQCKAVM